jgi:AcrR family transcriptional regulator
MLHRRAPQRGAAQSQSTRIVSAALDLAGDGYDAFRIRDVAQRAHISPGTIYHYFASKNDLLMACLERWLEEMLEAARIELAGMTGQLRRLRHLTALLTTGLHRQPLLADAFGRAYLFAASVGAGRPDLLRSKLSLMFDEALDGRPRRDGVGDLWSANMPAFDQQRRSMAELHERLECAAIGMLGAVVHEPNCRPQPAAGSSA